MNTHKCTDTILLDALSSDLSYSWSDWARAGNDWAQAGKRLLVAEIARVLPMIRVWMHRQTSRKHLAKLNATLLDDIGLSKIQAQAESSKAFWEK